MNGTMNAGEPSYTTGGDTPNKEEALTSGLGLFFVVLLLIIILSYTSYRIYKRGKWSPSPPLPPTTAFDDISDSDDDEYHFTRLSQGIDDNVLATFPTFLYSEVVTTLLKDEINTDTHNVDDNYVSGCSICLADYRPVEVIRLLPECGHLFHVSCVDTWLKVQPTCPVCRKSPLPTPTDLN